MGGKELVNLTQAKTDAEAAAKQVSDNPAAAKKQAKDDAQAGKTDAKAAAQADSKAAAKVQADETTLIGDAFKVQMQENHVQQLSEMTTSVESASNSAIGDMARNVKS